MRTMLEFLAACEANTCDRQAAQRFALQQTLRLNPALRALREWREDIVDVSDGPLSGVTVSAKDNIGVEGMQTWAGSAMPLPDKWRESGSYIRRLQALGAVVTSKSHCAEFALGGSGYNPKQGTPRNPWSGSTDLVPGGSSSGTAVAVASGMAMLGIGTDTGGSVRVPAALCGCVGYRASIEHWPMDGVVPLLTRSDTLGLITREIPCLVHAVNAIDNTPPIKATPLNGLRVAIWPKALMQDCDTDRSAALENAASALGQAGCTLNTAGQEAIEFAFELLEGGPNTAAIEFARFLNSQLPEWRDTLNQQVASMVGENESISDEVLQARNNEFLALSDRLEDFFAGADFVLSPTTALAPPPIQALDSVAGYERYSNGLLGFTVMGSMYRCCGISLPAGLDSNGLPMGLQLLGRPGDDHRLLAAALSVQALLPKTPCAAGV